MMNNQIIENKQFSKERDLYGQKDIVLRNCLFDGVEDGESALKEGENIEIYDTTFALRYPLWHGKHLEIHNSQFLETARAAIWYSNDILISNTLVHGIKALRECHDISLKNVDIVSDEFGWKCFNFKSEDISLKSEYAFFESSNINLKNFKFDGKYSFQYTKNVVIENSILHTKDCFWHCENAIIKNCIIKGEYLAWYAKNLTFINCQISGTQPFCYCDNLKLIDCTMEGCDLAFEYSEVYAKINSRMKSIKNPRAGRIEVLGVDEIILSEDSKYPTHAEIVTSK